MGGQLNRNVSEMEEKKEDVQLQRPASLKPMKQRDNMRGVQWPMYGEIVLILTHFQVENANNTSQKSRIAKYKTDIKE